jgi:hypothetical protein
VPDNNQFTDLLVQGKILLSNGEALELQIKVTDARGIEWLDKRYMGITSSYAYQRKTIEKQDPFLAVYRLIANDLLKLFSNRSSTDRLMIRQVAELRFARDFASGAFGEYLEENESGKLKLTRLPSEDDPMLARIRGIRQRHYVFVDTLQSNYTEFADEMYDPYQKWRELSYEETVIRRKMESEATRELIMGGAAILAGVAASTSGNSIGRAAGAVGVMGGGKLIKSGMAKREEAKIASLTLEELAMTLDNNIAPRVIELEDRTVRLTGNVEDQYDQWRELLADIYAAELAALEPPQPEPHSPSLLPDTQDP